MTHTILIQARWARWLAACLLAALLAGCIGDSNQNPSGQPGNGNSIKPNRRPSSAARLTGPSAMTDTPVSSSRRQFIKRGGARPPVP